jgi:RNA polymerase sigma-70 factor, ECF subfamily
MNTTSITLLEQLRTPGRPDAWRRFVHLYTPLLYHWARRLELSAEDAADLVQEVLILLVQRLPQFAYDRRGSFRGWLRTVLVNRGRDLRRRLARSACGRQSEHVPEPEVDDNTLAFDEAEYRQHLVKRALELMQTDFEPVTWKACWESTVADRPAAEVARELGISVNAVYLAKARVLSRLRQELDGLLD